MLTYLVTITVQKAGGAVEALFTEQEATVNAIIGLTRLDNFAP